MWDVATILFLSSLWDVATILFFILPAWMLQLLRPTFSSFGGTYSIVGWFFSKLWPFEGTFCNRTLFINLLIYWFIYLYTYLFICKRECPEGAIQTIDILITKKSSDTRIKGTVCRIETHDWMVVFIVYIIINLKNFVGYIM
jgi:hypothetical protein